MGDHSGDNWWWRIQKVPEWAREEDAASESGLRIFSEGPSLSLDDYLDASALPEELSADIQKIYSACTAKFASYSDSRRILLLHPYGDSELKDADWWKEVWIGLPPPPEIDEIWCGTFDWIDDETKDWTFERLYSTAEVRGEISLTR